ncbi:leucine rich repeat family protein [Anaeramoeba flamelloides]|uniref:Leucine rich repeat family protein n=1 Tax=Anaeramoeba flamelloides TaxID=1746091 RepID=A0AAV7ZLT0_9EUKA|nr:leucine rich repeat family protein [Anaeramoeba flamelloides]
MDLLTFEKLLLQVETNNPKVVNLNLWSCGQPTRCLTLLFDHLSTNTHIKTIDLGNNDLTDQDLLEFCRSLVKNYTVRHLVLSFNQITDQGVQHLFSLLKTNKTICSIDLSRNKITNNGGKIILSNLNVCRSLFELDLSMNKVARTLDERICFILNRRRKYYAIGRLKSRAKRRSNGQKKNVQTDIRVIKSNQKTQGKMPSKSELDSHLTGNILRKTLLVSNSNQSESETDYTLPSFAEISFGEDSNVTDQESIFHKSKFEEINFETLSSIKTSKNSKNQNKKNNLDLNETSNTETKKRMLTKARSVKEIMDTNLKITTENSGSGMISENLFEELSSENSGYYSTTTLNANVDENLDSLYFSSFPSSKNDLISLDPLSEVEYTPNEIGLKNETEIETTSKGSVQLNNFRHELNQIKVVLSNYLRNSPDQYSTEILKTLKNFESGYWDPISETINEIKEEFHVLKESTQKHRKKIRNLKSNLKVLQKEFENTSKKTSDYKNKVKVLQKTSNNLDVLLSKKKI